LRIIEDEATRGRGEKILLRAGREAAVYVLNRKRAELADIEHRYGVSIEVVIDETFEGARMAVESSGPRPTAAPRVDVPIIDDEDELEIIDEVLEDEDEEAEEEADEADTVEISLEGEDAEPRHESAEGDRQGRRRRRRRRGGRGRSRREGGESDEVPVLEQPIAAESETPTPADTVAEEPAAEGGRRRRRRGGRKPAEGAEPAVEPDNSPMVERPIEDEPPIAETAPAEEAKPKRRRSKKADAEAEATAPEPPPAPPVEVAEKAAPAKPARKSRSKKAAEPALADAEPAAEGGASRPTANNDTAEDENGEPRRGGWWQRTFG